MKSFFLKEEFIPFGAVFASIASPWVAPTVIEIELFQSYEEGLSSFRAARTATK